MIEVIERDRPRLRPVEALPDPGSGRTILRDPTQLASGMLVVGEAELLLLSLLDGERDEPQIQSDFARRSGQLLLSEQLDALLRQLESAGYLAGRGFEAYYGRLLEEYRRLPFRPLRNSDGFGVPAADLPGWLEESITLAPTESGAL